MHQSVATLDNPEFINLQPLDINPLMSQCEIKVLYVGKNRNGSFISKDTASEMAKTLRGAPIVGYYSDDKEDFRDHGHEVTIDGDGIHFACKTVPYGFVAPDAKVWFQTFDEVDEFDNKIQREYLMTTGYLWTGQFEECASAVNGEGKNQSMELDEASLDGYWSQDNNGMEFFIINDAIFSKLCILGDDVEPCFEGAKVSAPSVSSSFSLDKNFKDTLYNMMQQLNFALKGGTNTMLDEQKAEITPSDKTADVVDNSAVDKVTDVVDNSIVDSSLEKNDSESDFKKGEEEKKDEETKKDEYEKKDEDKEDEKKDDSDDSDKTDDTEDKDDDDKKKFELQEEKISGLESSLTELETSYSTLKESYDALIAEYNSLMSEKKKALINSFSMLSDDEKKDVVENMDKYTVDEIESKLSVIFARREVKNVSQAEDKNENIKEDSLVFSLDESSNEPAWIKAVKAVEAKSL